MSSEAIDVDAEYDGQEQLRVHLRVCCEPLSDQPLQLKPHHPPFVGPQDLLRRRHASTPGSIAATSSARTKATRGRMKARGRVILPKKSAMGL